MGFAWNISTPLHLFLSTLEYKRCCITCDTEQKAHQKMRMVSVRNGILTEQTIGRATPRSFPSGSVAAISPRRMSGSRLESKNGLVSSRRPRRQSLPTRGQNRLVAAYVTLVLCLNTRVYPSNLASAFQRGQKLTPLTLFDSIGGQRDDVRLAAMTTTRGLREQTSTRLSGDHRATKKMKPMPIVGYEAKEICEYYDRRPLEVGWRLNSLSLPLLGEKRGIYLGFIQSAMPLFLQVPN